MEIYNALSLASGLAARIRYEKKRMDVGSRAGRGRDSTSRCPLVILLALLMLAAARGASAGCDEAGPCGYAGAFVGSGRMYTRIVDIDGFANWGHPGSGLDYADVELVGGGLVGTRFDVGGALLRIEVDATAGGMAAATNRLDPAGLDETAESEFRWVATAGGGIERAIGRVAVFATGGLAIARIADSVTDVDYSRTGPPRIDLDDSFHDVSTDIGWQVRIGVEASLTAAWALRLDASYLDFGRRAYEVNRSGDNRCGPGGPRRPCPYSVRHELGLVRLAVVYRFAL